MDPSTGSGQAEDSGDAAAEAFEGVRAEVALLRRAVERLAAERAEIPEQPDYSETLGRIAQGLTATAQRVDVLTKSSLQAMTPLHVASQIVAAGSDARRGDQQIIAEARSRLDEATRELAGVVASARRSDEQNLWLAGAGIGGMLVGMALWVALAGPIARGVPENWHWSERMAARAMDLPMWQAGQRLMDIASPENWRAIVTGDAIVRANRDAIKGCRKAAAKVHGTVRCTIRVGR